MGRKQVAWRKEGRWNGFGENESDENDGDRRAKTKKKVEKRKEVGGQKKLLMHKVELSSIWQNLSSSVSRGTKSASGWRWSCGTSWCCRTGWCCRRVYAGATGGAELAAFWRLCTCAPQVVEACGHPTPGPWRFCKVMVAIWKIVNWDCTESSSGKGGTATAVLFMHWPAATLAFRSAMNWSLLGGQSQGIAIGWPLEPVTPVQLPELPSLMPGVTSNWGIRLEFTSRFMNLLCGAGVADTNETIAEKARTTWMNFMTLVE
jgi:hypothetical protein